MILFVPNLTQSIIINMQSIELSIGGEDDDIALPEDAPEDEAKMNAKA